MLSKKQAQILEFIKQEFLSKGYPPTVREICRATGLKSPSTVHMHLRSLEAAGYIRRDPTKPRAIEVTDPEFSNIRHNSVNIPLIGRVAAGIPITAIENIEDYIPLPSFMLPSGRLFALRVQGDSMTGAGIMDGDIIICRRQNVAENGEIVVAMHNGEATVKRFYNEDGHIRLQPENDFMNPIILDNCEILGKVSALLRLY